MFTEAFRHNPATSHTSGAEMEQAASKWLRFAGVHSGGRQCRALKAAILSPVDHAGL